MHFPTPIPFKSHFLSTLVATWCYYLIACITTIDQNTKRFSHQLSALPARLALYLSKAGILMLIVPAFHFIKYLPGFFQKGCSTSFS
jgi:hypothetical protein